MTIATLQEKTCCKMNGAAVAVQLQVHVPAA
jgi:hypothetical protein